MVIAYGLLGRHVRRRADGDSRLGQPRAALHRPRDAEVGDHRPSAFGLQEDVVGLDVAVDDAAQMGVRQRVGDLGEGATHFFDGAKRSKLQVRRQRAASHERHDEIGDSVVLAHVEDRDDVRV